MYRDVLVATDGSDVAATAAEYGLEIARTADAMVHAITVVESGAAATVESVSQSRVAAARERVDAVEADATSDGVPVLTRVLAGRAGREILAYAEEHDIDLLVLGTTGRSGMRRLLTGSVATVVVRDARQPVLTVGPSVTTVSRPFERILVATDGRPGVEDAVEQALSLAEAYDATLHALYVVDESRPHLQVVREEYERVGAESTREVAARADDRGVSTVTAIEGGVPAETIVSYATDHDVDLLVMGTESRSGLDRLVIGSVSQHVVNTATVPVLTVRAGD